MVTAMVVNSAGITALAKEGNADFDESDIIVICTDAEDGTDDGEFDEKDSIIEDSEESEKEETEEKEDGEESEDNKDTEEESEDIKDTEDEEESEDDKGIEDGIEVEDSDENDEEDLNKVINKLELTADATYSNSELAAYTEIVLNGYTLTVTDDFSTNASISLGTGQLIVKGNMTASNYVNGANGEITIEGTYTQTANRIGVGSKMTVQNDFVISNGGFISASGSSGRVIVGGNLIYKSAEDMDFNNTATWIVSGNVIQEEYSGKYNAGNIVLNGTVPQTLSLQSNSTIGNLTVNNSDVNLEGYLYGVSLQSDFEPTTTGKIYTYNLRTDSAYRVAHAFAHVRSYRTDVQSVADSMIYNSLQHKLSLFGNPIIWNENRQILGEEIFAYFNDSSIDSIHVVNQALMAERLDSVHYNQVAGREMNFYFENGQLKENRVIGNVLVNYFAYDDDSLMIGMNHTETSLLRLFMENKQLSKIWTRESKGTFYPLLFVTDKEAYLSNFAWFDYMRPSSAADIFIWVPKAAGTELKRTERRVVPFQSLKGIKR